MGTDRNLVIDNGYRWTETVPTGAWHLSGGVKLYSDRCLDTVLQLNDRKLSLDPPDKFCRVMQRLAPGCHPVPWSKVMPEAEHRAFVRRLINEASEAMATISRDYYASTWVPGSAILRCLEPATVDIERLETYTSNAGLNTDALKGFKPTSASEAQAITYDRLATRTGRLTVASGPGILTLKREHRDVIVPTDPGGAIVYVDFAALEARIILYEGGKDCPERDMYGALARDLFCGSASRDQVKGAVISELYGSGKGALGERLGISGKDLDDFVTKVRSYFSTGLLKKRLKDEFIKLGHIHNHHGRRVPVDEPLDHLFLNYYAQSTGVDVSLLGFSSLWTHTLRHMSGVRPLFVLHDALVLDVPREHLGAILSLDRVTVPGYEQPFFLKSSTSAVH